MGGVRSLSRLGYKMSRLHACSFSILLNDRSGVFAQQKTPKRQLHRRTSPWWGYRFQKNYLRMILSSFCLWFSLITEGNWKICHWNRKVKFFFFNKIGSSPIPNFIKIDVNMAVFYLLVHPITIGLIKSFIENKFFIGQSTGIRHKEWMHIQYRVWTGQ